MVNRVMVERATPSRSRSRPTWISRTSSVPARGPRGRPGWGSGKPAARVLESSLMTATSLPDTVCEVFDRFVTTEYTTIDRRGQPITWPVTPYHHREEGCVDITTGLGYPKKAYDARANPKVSLLFSDPTGAASTTRRWCSCRAWREVDDRDLEANRERYWEESAAKLPATKDMHPPKFLRGAFNWYYARLYVHVRPERVYLWPGGDVSAEPELLDSHMEEVRSGHDEEPDVALEPPEGGTPVWDGRMDELGDRYSERRPLDRLPRRLPVLGARTARRRPERAPRAAGRRRASASRRTPGPPASPSTSTVRDSSGSGTSRCAATSWSATATGCSCRTSWSAGSSCRPARCSRDTGRTSEDAPLPQDREARARPSADAVFRRLRDRPRECLTGRPTWVQMETRDAAPSATKSGSRDEGPAARPPDPGPVGTHLKQRNGPRLDFCAAPLSQMPLDLRDRLVGAPRSGPRASRASAPCRS